MKNLVFLLLKACRGVNVVPQPTDATEREETETWEHALWTNKPAGAYRRSTGRGIPPRAPPKSRKRLQNPTRPRRKGPWMSVRPKQIKSRNRSPAEQSDRALEKLRNRALEKRKHRALHDKHQSDRASEKKKQKHRAPRIQLIHQNAAEYSI